MNAKIPRPLGALLLALALTLGLCPATLATAPTTHQSAAGLAPQLFGSNAQLQQGDDTLAPLERRGPLVFAHGGEQATGFENATAPLTLAQIGRYSAGMTNADGGVLEIVDYNDKTGWAYAINGQKGVLTAVPMATQHAQLSATSRVQQLDGFDIDVKTLVTDFDYGDMTSVAVSPDGTLLAAALQAKNYQDNGRVALLRCHSDGTLTLQATLEVGVQPDMVSFTPDGTRLLLANEGEPRQGYGTDETDPMGSVSILTLDSGTVVTVDFTPFDTVQARTALVNKGIVLKQNTNPSVDLEPEYIAATNSTAYVALQEANAIAVLDLDTQAFTDIYSVGFEDYSKVAVDIDKNDETYLPKTHQGLKGIRMPDAISLYQRGGSTYLLTANEGDSRDWNGYSNEKEAKKNAASPAGNIPANTIGGKVLYFDTTDYNGLDATTDYLFGARSFSVLRVEPDGLVEIFDSGNDFERLSAQYLPRYFNCSNDDLTVDDRSGKKGPEPETVTVGTVGASTYAFVTLERIGGVMVYDITIPESARYVNYINSRDFSAAVGDDDSPEGLRFIPAASSPTGDALLLAACEVGGTLAAYALVQPAPADADQDASDGAPSNPRPVKPVTPLPEPVSLPFLDVAAGSWYARGAGYAYENGLLAGTSATTFSPETMATRAMIATLLYRLAGSPLVTDPSPFADVASDAYYANAVTWAAQSGVLVGQGGNQFDPDGGITRQQLAASLYQYATRKGYDTTLRGNLTAFADGNTVAAEFLAAMQWVYANGVMQGTDTTTLSPEALVTRAQLTTILMGFCEGFLR